MWCRWSMKLHQWSAFASETSSDAKQVSSQEKSALKTTYRPKTKELIRDIRSYNVLFLFACQNCLNGVMHARVNRLVYYAFWRTFLTLTLIATFCQWVILKKCCTAFHSKFDPAVWSLVNVFKNWNFKYHCQLLHKLHLFNQLTGWLDRPNCIHEWSCKTCLTLRQDRFTDRNGNWRWK